MSLSRHHKRRRVGDWWWSTVEEAVDTVGNWVDIIGIVVEFGIPHKSNGTDYCVILKIIDPDSPDFELSVNAFHKSIDHLPIVHGHLDVILLHNVLIDSYKQKPCVSFRKASSFALFHGQSTVDCDPYRISPGFHGVESAAYGVRNMQFHSSIVPFDAGISEYTLTLADIEGKQFIDLVCKVLHVCKVSRGRWMLFVWDGTDAPQLSLTNKLTDEEHNSLPLHIEPLHLPVHVVQKFPCVGTVLRIIVDESYDDFDIHFHHNERWARLRNLMCNQKSGLWEGVFTLTTKFRPLSEENDSVKKCLRVYNGRLCNLGRVPSAAFPRFDILTVIGNGEANYASLMDLLCTPLANGCFKCVVRVVAMFPSQVKDLRSSEGIYRLRLTLEDPTARIHAYLSHEDAVVLFGGYPDVDMLAIKINKLIGVLENHDSPRNPPWVECCLGFLCSPDANDVGNKVFHICNTRFLV